MSETADPAQPVTVERDGITVTKSLALDEFPVPTVVFELTSARASAAKVRLRDHVPDGHTLDTVGFHAEYESEHWDAYQDNRIEFTRTIQPEETVRTLYGLRLTDPAAATAFMGAPELVTVTPITEAVDPTGGTGADPADAPSAAPEAPGPVAGRLAEELRAGDVEDADLTAISEALGLDLSESADARLRHLQSRVEDLMAYSDPVVEFIDDDGPGAIEGLDERLDAIDERLTALEATVEELADWREAHDERHGDEE